MSENNRPDVLPGYFAIEICSLRENTQLPFDCFIYLEKNKKMVHWIREGGVFSSDHLTKFAKFKQERVYLPDYHRPNFRHYVGLPSEEASEASAGSLSIREDRSGAGASGHVRNFIHVKGGGEFRFQKINKIQSKASIVPAPAVAPAPKIRIDADFLNVILVTTQAVFNEICHSAVSFQPPSRRTAESKKSMQVDVASFIALTTQTIRGTIGLCFPKATYLALLSSATGQTLNDLDSSLALGAGEFIYQIFEAARPNFFNLGYNVDHAVPALIYAEDLSTPYVIPDPGFSILFESQHGKFQLEIGLKIGL